MKKIVLITILSIGFLSFGQESKQTNTASDFWSNVRFGGGFGLNFGNNLTTINITPTAIYDFNEKFSLQIFIYKQSIFFVK